MNTQIESDEFVNQFFFGKPNATEEEKRIYREKMAAYMKRTGLNPDTAEWHDPKEVLLEQSRIEQSN